ncbi:MAG: hypothetical protein QF790_09915 [Gammaproteobacteria bacterium]|nr:hypothetical protein [Gammaproteobacteria bacterium]MDP6617466.1 hypothetical protein [Gammaproteobacteria bacterium]MDP6695663.1 hypothetical protein [Gammaproteobacteria bacterium]
MTACSSHPGTIAGAALKGLLEEADQLGDVLRQRIDAAARSQNLDYASYSLLSRIAGIAEANSDELLTELCERGFVCAEGKPGLLPEGAKVIAAVDSEVCAWLDEKALENNTQQYRELADKLRAMRQNTD